LIDLGRTPDSLNAQTLLVGRGTNERSRVDVRARRPSPLTARAARAARPSPQLVAAVDLSGFLRVWRCGRAASSDPLIDARVIDGRRGTAVLHWTVRWAGKSVMLRLCNGYVTVV
jgi:hypothetical protein